MLSAKCKRRAWQRSQKAKRAPQYGRQTRKTDATRLKNAEKGLRIFRSCRGLIDDLEALQADDADPNDAATEPHAVTHRPDALHYLVQGRPQAAALPEPEDEDGGATAYDDAMRGGVPGRQYVQFTL